jgi:hypothetical protein
MRQFQTAHFIFLLKKEVHKERFDSTIPMSAILLIFDPLSFKQGQLILFMSHPEILISECEPFFLQET